MWMDRATATEQNLFCVLIGFDLPLGYGLVLADTGASPDGYRRIGRFHPGGKNDRASLSTVLEAEA